jgi:multidrug efflux system membrane fusion protein
MPLPPAQDLGSATERDLDPHHALPSAAITDPAHQLPATTEEPRAKGSWTRKIIVISVILAAIGIATWRIYVNQTETAVTNKSAAAAANRPTPVLVSLVQQKTVPVYLTALGTVTAYNTVTLHSRVDGQLLKVNFQEGQSVREGQLLLQIDPRPYQATVAQAQGQLAKDEATQKNAAAEAQRYTALYQAGVVSKESQQTQISNEGQAAGSIAADNAAIQAAKVNLSYTSIYSPITGVVGLRGVDPGNIVHASDATGLVVITQIHPIALIFTLPEDQLPQVQEAMHGSKLVVEAYDRNDSHKIAEGHLLTIDNQIDTTTGTAKLKAVFDNTDNALFPNQFVNVRLILRDRPNATVVPTAAIQSGTQGNFVFVVHPGPTPANKLPAGAGAAGAGGGQHKGGGKPADSGAPAASGAGAPGGAGGANANAPKFHVDVVSVHVDFAQGANTILSDGALHNGDQVVIDGQEKLTDGSNVVPTHGTPPAGTGKGSVATPGAQPPDTSTPSATPQPGQAQPPNGGQHRHGGNPNGAGGNGTGNGGGEAE